MPINLRKGTMKFYTGIGSRKTPKEILELMRQLGESLANDGWTLRSGAAEGADTAFMQGWLKWAGSHRDEAEENPLAQIYLPWENFCGQTSRMIGNVIVQSPHKLEKAEEIVSKVHPYWKNCGPAARVLHTRNVFQVLGAKLNEPSKFVLYWAPEKNGIVQGGTATAVHLARQHGITTYNLLDEAVRVKMKKFLANS